VQRRAHPVGGAGDGCGQLVRVHKVPASSTNARPKEAWLAGGGFRRRMEGAFLWLLLWLVGSWHLMHARILGQGVVDATICMIEYLKLPLLVAWNASQELNYVKSSVDI
jgi:hypothetical protein